MMRRGHHEIITAIAGLLATSLAGGAGPSATTRGELARTLVNAAGIAVRAGNPEREAVERLRGLGIDLGTDLKRPVTEADLVEIGRKVGTEVRTADPDRPVSPGKVRAFAQLLKGGLLSLQSAAEGGTSDIRISCQGRDSRAGRRGAPASPADPNATAPPCEVEPLP
ncbi:MAG: hypothetical protein ACE5JH_08675 [Acidobacteriota bacterium]